MKRESVKRDGTVEVILTATDSGSGLWPYPILAKPMGKDDMNLSAQYGSNCGGLTPTYISFPNTGDRSRNSAPISYNP